MANNRIGYDYDYDYPYGAHYWWGAPNGFTDLELYDYNNNFILDDDEVADVVRDNIYDDPYITLSDTANIQVDVDDGVVTLSGTVRNPRSKPLAYADAYWSSGVVDVNNDIEVKPRQRKQQSENNQRQMKEQNHRQEQMAH